MAVQETLHILGLILEWVQYIMLYKTFYMKQ